MGTSRTRRSVVGALALLVAALGAACEDEDPSDPPTSAAPSRSDTTSPTEPTTTPTGPVEPTLPAAAEAGTKAGAEAFVGFYWAVVNYATKTGDVRLLKQLDQPSCEGCAGGIEWVERVYARGGHVIGGDYEVTRLRAIRSPGGTWSVVTDTTIENQRVVGAGGLNKLYPGGRGKWLVAVNRVNNAWSVSTLEGL